MTTFAATKFVHAPISVQSPFRSSTNLTEQFTGKLTFWWPTLHPWRKRLEGHSHAVPAEAATVSATQGSTDSSLASDTASSDTETTAASIPTAEENSADTNGTTAKSDRLEQLRFQAAAAVLPHPDKVGKGGEDAFFIADNGLALGIADGVGSWSERNIDPGLYSRMLMEKSKQAVLEIPLSEDVARQVLIQAHKQTNLMGSSTACVVLLDGSKLRTANLGDSGFMVLRKERILFVSSPQQHSFNFPYQLAGPNCSGDNPRNAEKFELDMRKGDVLILTTDGVSDNVWPQEAAAVVSTIMRRGGPPKVAAAGLANFARFRSEDQGQMTPFAYGAQQANMTFGGGRPYLGGKPDDITVVVGLVTGASKL